MPAYTITAVSDQTRPWTAKQGGEMVEYRVHLRDPQGQLIQSVAWSRKVSSPPPEKGQELEGELKDEGQYGMKFKAAMSQRVSFGGGRGKDPQERAEIRRQHSHTSALRWAELQHTRGKLPEDFGVEQVLIVADRFFQQSGEAS